MKTIYFVSVQTKDEVTVTTAKVSSEARKKTQRLALPKTQAQSGWWRFTPTTADAVTHETFGAAGGA